MIPSGILVDPVIWPQLTWAENWGVVPFFLGRGLASHLAQCGLAEACLHAKCYLYPSSRLVVIDMGRKLGDCAPLLFFLGGAESPASTVWPGPKPISIPSGILIHPAVWPQ